MDRDERLKELDDKYEDYEIYDNAGEKIGKVDDVFLNETDREEYIGVKMGLFGLSGKTLIPMEIARVDEQERRIEVAASKDQAKNAPHYHDDIDHEFEAKIREHFGVEAGSFPGARHVWSLRRRYGWRRRHPKRRRWGYLPCWYRGSRLGGARDAPRARGTRGTRR